MSRALCVRRVLQTNRMDSTQLSAGDQVIWFPEITRLRGYRCLQ